MGELSMTCHPLIRRLPNLSCGDDHSREARRMGMTSSAWRSGLLMNAGPNDHTKDATGVPSTGNLIQCRLRLQHSGRTRKSEGETRGAHG